MEYFSNRKYQILVDGYDLSRTKVNVLIFALTKLLILAK